MPDGNVKPPVGVVVTGRLPGDLFVKMRLEDSAGFAPIWRYAEGDLAGQIAPWPLDWEPLTEDENV